MTGRSAPTVAVEMGAAWLPRRTADPVVVGAGSVVVVVGSVVVGSALVVVASVVVGCTVVVGAVEVVLGSTVVVGAVTIGWLVVADVDGAWVVVVPPAVAGAPVVAGPVVVIGPPPARGTVSGVVVDGVDVVVGRRGALVVVDADVGAGSAGEVGSAAPGARRGGGGWWGTRAAEATRAARTAVVSPKAKNGSRQGRRGAARCRGRRVGIVASSRFDSFFRLMGCLGTRAVRGHSWRSCAQGIERCIRCRRCSRALLVRLSSMREAGRSPDDCPSSYPREREAVFSQTETCLVLSLVNGSRLQPPQRSRSVIPASRAIRSSSEGHT
jgi:hypothetical protein